MWQCEYHSPVLNWYKPEATNHHWIKVTQERCYKNKIKNRKRIFSLFFLFKSWSDICKAHQSNALLQYMYVLAECVCGGGGGGKGYWLSLVNDNTISQVVQQHIGSKVIIICNLKRTALSFVLTHCPWFYHTVPATNQFKIISWCVGFRGQGSMYQALVSHFELFDNFVTIRILFLQKKCLVLEN